MQRTKPAIRPRIVTDAQLAQYLGKSTGWIMTHRLRLEEQGLPRRLAVVGGNDLNAVDQWLDRMHQSVSEPDDPEIRRLWKEVTRNVLD